MWPNDDIALSLAEVFFFEAGNGPERSWAWQDIMDLWNLYSAQHKLNEDDVAALDERLKAEENQIYSKYLASEFYFSDLDKTLIQILYSPKIKVGEFFSDLKKDSLKSYIRKDQFYGCGK